MIKGLIALCVVVAIQVSSAFEVAVPVFKQPYGVKETTRIINGKTAIRGQFPYQAGIDIDDTAFCGGSLISPGWILTAAHCVDGYEKWTVILGAHNVRDKNEFGCVTLTSRKGTYHEDYDYITIINDIAVIELPEKVTLNAQINVIPLPPRSYQNEDFTGETVRVSGWGKTSDETNSISSKLQFVDLTMISFNECWSVFGDHIVESKFCCNGDNHRSTCEGDSGGPLTIGSGKNLTNLGIISFGSSRGCALGYPSGFTATAYFVDWISNKTGIVVQD